jgi:hypothetical protein
MAAKRSSVIAVMARLALACMLTNAALSQPRASQLENQMRRILVSIDADISGEAGVLRTRVRCKVESFGEQFCIQSSMVVYAMVMKAIADGAIDVSGKTLEFATLMPPRPRKGESTEFVVWPPPGTERS